MSRTEEQRVQLQELYPDLQWKKLAEADRSLNWELIFGPQESGYWTTVDPLDHYEWRGVQQTLADIQEMIDALPTSLFYDLDFGEFIGEEDPYQMNSNWEENEDGELNYMGPWEYSEVALVDVLLSNEVRRIL